MNYKFRSSLWGTLRFSYLSHVSSGTCCLLWLIITYIVIYKHETPQTEISNDNVQELAWYHILGTFCAGELNLALCNSYLQCLLGFILSLSVLPVNVLKLLFIIAIFLRTVYCVASCLSNVLHLLKHYLLKEI